MKNIIVLDKMDYKDRNEEFMTIAEETLPGKSEIIYTEYEDETIRRVRNYKYIGSALQHFLYWRKSYKYAKKILKSDADIIYCINPIVGIFLGLFNKKKRIVIGGFLFEPKKNKLYYKLRLFFAKKSLLGINRAIVYGKNEVDYYKKLFGMDKFSFIKYGIDFDNTQKYEGKPLPEHYFFSGGGSNRDYKTLVDGYNMIHTEPLVIVTQPWRLDNMNLENIIVLKDVVVENFGDVLKRADLLVLSLKNTELSAGHMVMFQAMSLGVPILVNDIPAIRDYVDEQDVAFYESGNAESLAEKLKCFKSEKNSYYVRADNSLKIYENELTFSAMLKRFLQQ